MRLEPLPTSTDVRSYPPPHPPKNPTKYHSLYPAVVLLGPELLHGNKNYVSIVQDVAAVQFFMSKEASNTQPVSQKRCQRIRVCVNGVDIYGVMAGSALTPSEAQGSSES